MYDMYERIHFERVNPVHSNYLNSRGRKKRDSEKDRKERFKRHLSVKLKEKYLDHINTVV